MVDGDIYHMPHISNIQRAEKTTTRVTCSNNNNSSSSSNSNSNSNSSNNNNNNISKK